MELPCAPHLALLPMLCQEFSSAVLSTTKTGHSLGSLLAQTTASSHQSLAQAPLIGGPRPHAQALVGKGRMKEKSSIFSSLVGGVFFLLKKS